MDRIVELYSGSLTYAQLVAGIDLITPAVGETAIIRDLAVSCQNPIGVDFSIGPDLVASTYNGARMTGSEVVPHGKSLRATGDIRFGFNKLQSLTTTTLQTFKRRTAFGGAAVTSPLYVRETNLTGFSLSASPLFYCVSPSGNLYYMTGSSGQNVLRRTGNYQGSDTSYAVGYGVVYDGSRHIYGWEVSSTIRRLDTQTDTVTNVLVSGLGGIPAEFNMTFVDGYLVARRSHSQTDNVILVNPATGALTVLATDTDGSSSPLIIGVGRRKNGDYIVVMGRTGSGVPNTSWLNIGASLSAPNLVARGVLNVNWISITQSSVPTGLHRNPHRPSILTQFSSSQAIEFDVETMTASPNIDHTTTTAMTRPVFDPVLAAADLGTVRVRITGILTTED